MKTVELSKLAEEMDLKNLTPEVDMSGVKVTTPEINRPALQLTGYLEHFEATRVQIIGYVEFSYLQHLDREARETAFERLVSENIPCVIFTTQMVPDQDLLELAKKHKVSVSAQRRRPLLLWRRLFAGWMCSWHR